MPNGMYGGVRGKETKIGRKTISFPYLLDWVVARGLCDGVMDVVLFLFLVAI